MQISLAEAIFRIISIRRDDISDMLMYGNIRNMEQYRELMGVLDGLGHVEQELKSLLEKQEQDDD
jgi:hypothetical protein|tara:strand:- start:3818 stop:4012 length:195 start_codon:yes stop_codon:yes gene_type:complete